MERNEAARPGTERVMASVLGWSGREEKRPRRNCTAISAEDTVLEKLVRLCKLRWRVERDYQEMKGEVGLDHFEGRSWRGFHHHATLCMVAHGFLALHRVLFPPEQGAVDAASGAAAAPTPAAAPHRLLPPVPTPGQRSRASSWAV